jgi:hypothetical protein
MATKRHKTNWAEDTTAPYVTEDQTALPLEGLDYTEHNDEGIESDQESKKKRRIRRRVIDLTDPDAPKLKANSAWQAYSIHAQTEIRKENPGLSFGEISKRVSQHWKDDPNLHQVSHSPLN